jgi:hypothetical protein
MRSFFRNTRLLKGLLIVGVVAGFGSEIHHRAHHRWSARAYAWAS